MRRKTLMRKRTLFLRSGILLLIATVLSLALIVPTQAAQPNAPAGSVNSAFSQASQEFGVPASLLKALCYMEGRLSNHGGSPSIDNGFGCMHLVKNSNGDTLDQAARDLGVSTHQLQIDISTN